jgi:hypothetical protein
MLERLKDAIKTYRDKQGTRTNTVLENGIITAASAGTAGSIAAVITTPVDVVKTRIMLAAVDNAARETRKQGSERKGFGNAIRNGNGLVDAMGQTVKKPFARKSSVQIVKEVIAENGVRGLWRGGALRGVWTMVGSGLYLGVYESGRIFLANRRDERINEEELL